MTNERLVSWLHDHLPKAWFTGDPEITYDADEVLVVGTLAVPESANQAHEANKANKVTKKAPAELEAQRISAFRADTRAERIAIARAFEQRFELKLSWGARCGDRRELFTTVGVPVMTRLRLPERQVLDTLIAGGVARSRSDALAWCVRLVGQHEGDWLADLRDALVDVRRVRAEGPTPI